MKTDFYQAELTKQQNDFKIMLKKLEDDLLSRLSSAGGTLYRYTYRLIYCFYFIAI